MDDVRGDFLRPPHGTTPAAEMANKKIKLRSFKSSEHINEKKMGHTAVSASQASSVTLQIWQHGAKENNCNFATFNGIVDIRLALSRRGQIYMN